ncbi:hypothetical protein OE88DRAFT_1738774 [Heliocybe sulcata]|uniref:F-box domain-containing protein n=1 Tax=Heliocybe sulcata TaxID=5364 RepID=A0A5C3MQM3_9AGAM|nr:hypothetical protein OE88DRAFT_1738774 [Heliocybe sulcata]
MVNRQISNSLSGESSYRPTDSQGLTDFSTFGRPPITSLGFQTKMVLAHGLNYDVLSAIMVFLSPHDLRQVAASSKSLYDPATSRLVVHVQLARPEQVQSFHAFVAKYPGLLSLTRSFRFSPNETSVFDDHANGWSTGTDTIKSTGPLLADILEGACNLTSLELWYTDLLFCVPSLRQGLKAFCREVSTLKLYQFNTWKMTPEDVQDLGPMFEALRDRISHLEVKSIFEPPIKSLMKALGHRVETLAVALVSGNPNLVTSGAILPHVKNLRITGYRLLREEISTTFPNVRQLDICEDFLVKDPLHRDSQEIDEWRDLETLSGDLRDVARLGLTRPIQHLNLDTYEYQGSPEVDFFRIIRPRSLSISVHSDRPKIMSLFRNPEFWSSVTELSYMGLVIKDLTEWCGAVHNCWPCVAGNLHLTNARYFHLSIYRRKWHQLFLNMRWADSRVSLHKLAASAPCLEYIELEVHWLAGSSFGFEGNRVLYKVHPASGGQGLRLESMEPDLADSLRARYTTSEKPNYIIRSRSSQIV